MEEFSKVLGTAEAVINKVQTTADSGARITLDVGADASELIRELMSHKLSENGFVHVSFVKNEGGF